jgi:hypothetical protein
MNRVQRASMSAVGVLTSPRREALYLFLITGFLLFLFFLLDGAVGGFFYYHNDDGLAYRCFVTLYYPILLLAPLAIAAWYGRRIYRPWVAFLSAFCPFLFSAFYFWKWADVLYFDVWVWGERWIEYWPFYPTGRHMIELGIGAGLLGLGSALTKQHRWQGISIAACGAIIWLGMVIPVLIDYSTWWQGGRPAEYLWDVRYIL